MVRLFGRIRQWLRDGFGSCEQHVVVVQDITGNHYVFGVFHTYADARFYADHLLRERTWLITPLLPIDEMAGKFTSPPIKTNVR